MNFEVGHFRTPIMALGQLQVDLGGVAGIEDYKDSIGELVARREVMDGNQVRPSSIPLLPIKASNSS